METDAQQGSIRYCEDFLQPIYTAPWDRRWAYNDARLLGRARETVLKHLQRPNVALAFMRQSANQDGYDHFLAVDAPMTDRGFYSGHGTPYLAPLWLYENGRGANLRPEYLRELLERLGCGPLDQPANAQGAFAYLYGVFWNPEYRRRFAEALRDDFPRVPWPSSVADWNLHAGWGQRLLELHLPAAPARAVLCCIGGATRPRLSSALSGTPKPVVS